MNGHVKLPWFISQLTYYVELKTIFSIYISLHQTVPGLLELQAVSFIVMKYVYLYKSTSVTYIYVMIYV